MDFGCLIAVLITRVNGVTWVRALQHRCVSMGNAEIWTIDSVWIIASLVWWARLVLWNCKWNAIFFVKPERYFLSEPLRHWLIGKDIIWSTSKLYSAGSEHCDTDMTREVFLNLLLWYYIYFAIAMNNLHLLNSTTCVQCLQI